MPRQLWRLKAQQLLGDLDCLPRPRKKLPEAVVGLL